MDHNVKALAEAITNSHTSHLVHSHVKELDFDEEANHLTIHVDNAAPLHELESKECDHHLQSGMEKIYGDITYELKLHKADSGSDREKGIGHEVHR